MEASTLAVTRRVYLTGRLRWVRPASTSTSESKLQQEWAEETYDGVSITIN